jgi:hypothetical protein
MLLLQAPERSLLGILFVDGFAGTSGTASTQLDCVTSSVLETLALGLCYPARERNKFFDDGVPPHATFSLFPVPVKDTGIAKSPET